MPIPPPCKLAVFDVDGTLTQHHMPPTDAVRHMLNRLQRHCRVLLLSAGSCRRIAAQMQGISVEILGNYGMEYALPQKEGHYDIHTLHTYTFDRQDALRRIEAFRRHFGLTSFFGDSLTVRENGCLIFPLLGSEAPPSLRLLYDADRQKRLSLYDHIAAEFPDRHVFIGGTSCFDLPPKLHTKLTALQAFCLREGFTPEEVTVFGDDYMQHGNDEPLFLSEYRFVPVHTYESITQVAACLFPLL